MDKEIINLIDLAIKEDLGEGDHTSLASIPANKTGKARIFAKEKGVIAGVELGAFIFRYIDPEISITEIKKDGDMVNPGDDILIVEGQEQKLLQSERLVLNFMQRMSGIATLTSKYAGAIAGFKARLLDTRKTTPGLRKIEKWAVRTGGGYNHRMGLYDMIMLKENHIAYAGGIEAAIVKVNDYLKKKGKHIPIEVETRNLDEVAEVLEVGGVSRIMLDNFDIAEMRLAVQMINGRFEVEASGGVNLDTIRQIAETGVDFISVGALTHSVKSLDISMLAME